MEGKIQQGRLYFHFFELFVWSKIAYWALLIAIGLSRLWIGRSRLLLCVLGYGLGVAACY